MATDVTNFYGYEPRLGQTKLAFNVGGLKPLTRFYVYYNSDQISTNDIEVNYGGLGSTFITDSGGRAHVQFYVRKTDIQVQDYIEAGLSGASKQLAPVEIVFTDYNVARLPLNWKDLSKSFVILNEEWNPKFLNGGSIGTSGTGGVVANQSDVYRFYTFEANQFRLAQTVQIDPEAVGNADTIFVSSVDLYFKSKPTISAGTSRTLATNPGVSVYLCACDNGVPNLRQVYTQYPARVEYDSINVNAQTLPSPTKFTFNTPIPVPSGQKFAILVAFDNNEAFVAWTARAGDQDIVTGRIIDLNSGYVDGNLFELTNGRELTPQQSQDLAFNLRLAKFDPTQRTFKITNRAMEFLTYQPTSISGAFNVGEIVFQQSANLTGTVSTSAGNTIITGVGTSFATALVPGSTIVISNGTHHSIRTVNTIASNTSLTVTQPVNRTYTSVNFQTGVTGRLANIDYVNEKIVLTESTATNSAFRFATAGKIIGSDTGAAVDITSVDNYTVNGFVPNLNIVHPTKTESSFTLNFANTTYATSSARAQSSKETQLTRVTQYPAIIASRSNEVQNSTNLFTGARSLEYELTLKTTNQYTTPFLHESESSGVVIEYDINNDSTNEHTSYGNAASKAISRTITLLNTQLSEDLKVYVTAFRPFGTNVEVYARIYNEQDTEDFSAKNWTKLQLVDNVATRKYSDATNINDNAFLEFQMPAYHPGTEISGTFTVELNNSVITGTSGTVNTDLTAGDLIRVYNPEFPNNYFHTIVSAANTSTITVLGDGSPGTTLVVNSSLVSTGMKIVKVDTYKRSAFVDNQNLNIVRYHDNNGVRYDTFKIFALKFVMLSDSTTIAPFIKDYRAVAVSA